MSKKDQKPKPQGQKPAERPEIQESGSLFYTFIWALAIVFISVVLAHYATTENASMDTFVEWVKSLLPDRETKNSNPLYQTQIKRKSGTAMITQEELAKNIGTDGNPIWVSILGQVFDVTSKPQHYGPEGGYKFFAGKDGTRAFATGDFTPEGLISDVAGLSYIEVIGIFDWLKNFRRDYDRVGYLIGHYYTPEGGASEALLATRKYYSEGKKKNTTGRKG
jgi:cytochrome b involved in lipid metabolism